MLTEEEPLYKDEPFIWPRGGFCKSHNLGPTTFHALVNSGKLKVVKIGRSTGVLREEARRFRQSLLTEGQR